MKSLCKSGHSHDLKKSVITTGTILPMRLLLLLPLLLLSGVEKATVGASASPLASCTTATESSLSLLALQWTNAALIEYVYPPAGTTLHGGPAGSFLYTTGVSTSSPTTSPAVCSWSVGTEPQLALLSTSSSFITTWNATFAQWDEAFSKLKNVTSIDGVTGSTAQSSSSPLANTSIMSTGTVLLPSELCFAKPSIATTPNNASAFCVASLSSSNTLGCLLDPDNVIQNITTSTVADYLNRVVAQRALSRRWFSASIDFAMEAQQAYAFYSSTAASVASSATVSNVSAAERDLVLRGIASSLQPLLEAHFIDTLTQKWQWIESLIATSNLAFLSAASSTSTTSDCPTEFLSTWMTASSVSMGISIVEAALGTAVSLLLAAQSDMQVRVRTQCVLETYAVARFLEEDLPVFVTTSLQPQASTWTATTLMTLANLQLATNVGRLENIISTRLTLSAVLAMLNLLPSSPSGAATFSPPVALVAQCLADWFSNITMATSYIPSADDWSASSSSSAAGAFLQWLRQSSSTGVSQCFTLQTSSVTPIGYQGEDSNEPVEDMEWFLDFTNATNSISFEQITVGNATISSAIRGSLRTSGIPRLRSVSDQGLVPVLFTFLMPPSAITASTLGSSSAAVIAASTTSAIRSAGLPLGGGGSLFGNVFALINPPVSDLRPLPAATTTASSVSSFIWNDTVQGGPVASNSCGPGYLQLRDYDTNDTICEQCRNEPPAMLTTSTTLSSTYLFCTGDGYARACVNKPGGVGNDNISAYIPQGNSQLNSSDCPFYCRSYYQYRNGSRCVDTGVGKYANSNTSQDDCATHPALFSQVVSDLIVTPAATVSADFVKWSAYVSPGAFQAPNSCAFSVRRRMISERFDVTGGPGSAASTAVGGRTLANTLLWCNRSSQNFGRGSPAPPIGLQLRLQGLFTASDVLAAHRKAGSTRLAFQLAEVFGENESIAASSTSSASSSEADTTSGGWSWYLVTSIDVVSSTALPSTVSMQLWFNASFVASGNPTAFANAPHSLLFFSFNKTYSWSTFVTTVSAATGKKTFSAGVSLNLESGLLSFSLDGKVLGPVQSIPWTTSLTTAPCVTNFSAASAQKGKTLRLSIGGWLASFDSPLGMVVTRLGISDELPQSFYFLPINLTRVGFSGVPFGRSHFTSSTTGTSATTTKDVWSELVVLPSVENVTGGSSSSCNATTTASSSSFVLRTRVDDGSAFAATPPNRVNHLVYLNSLSSLFQQSNVTWNGVCRGGTYQNNFGSQLLRSSCTVCPLGSMWQTTASVLNSSTSSSSSSTSSSSSLAQRCSCLSTRALVNNTCIPLSPAYGTPTFVESNTTTSITDGSAMILNTNKREKTFLFAVAMNTTLATTSSATTANSTSTAASLILNGTLETTVSCTSTTVFGVPLTEIVIDCDDPLRKTLCSVYVTLTVDFSNSATSSSSGAKGDLCRISIRTTQLYRYPSSTIARQYTFWPKPPAVGQGNLNTVNGTILADTATNISLSVRNYSFYSTASTFFLAQAANTLFTNSSSSGASSSVDSPTLSLLQAMASSATASCQMVVLLSFHTSSPPPAISTTSSSSSWSSASTLVPMTSPVMFVFPATTAVNGMTLDFSLSTSSTSVSPFSGNVAVLNISITSSAGYFAPSDSLVVYVVSASYVQGLLTPVPNSAANALAHPAVIVLGILTLFMTSGAFVWTIRRRPPSCFGKLCQPQDEKLSDNSDSSSASSETTFDDDDDDDDDDDEESNEFSSSSESGGGAGEQWDDQLPPRSAASRASGAAAVAQQLPSSGGGRGVGPSAATTISSQHSNIPSQSATRVPPPQRSFTHSPFGRQQEDTTSVTPQQHRDIQPSAPTIDIVGDAHTTFSSHSAGGSVFYDMSFDRSGGPLAPPPAPRGRGADPSFMTSSSHVTMSGSIDHELSRSARSRWRQRTIAAQNGSDDLRRSVPLDDASIAVVAPVESNHRRVAEPAPLSNNAGDKQQKRRSHSGATDKKRETDKPGTKEERRKNDEREERRQNSSAVVAPRALSQHQQQQQQPNNAPQLTLLPPTNSKEVPNQRPWKTAPPLPPPFDR